jgi:hypothetical protein
MFNQFNPKHLLCLPLLALALTACPGGLPTPTSLATQIDAGTTRADWASFDTDALGNAVVVWQQSDGNANRVYANRSLASNHAWQGATIIDAGASNTAFNFTLPKVGLDAQGNGMAVWAQILNGFARIYANRFTAASGTWGTPVIVDAGATGAAEPSLTVDAQGFATVVWKQLNPQGINRIYANQWNPNTKQWGDVDQLDSQQLTAPSKNPIVRTDTLGNVVAVWSQEQNDGFLRLFTSRRERSKSGVWLPPIAIDTPLLGKDQIISHLAFDVLGNMLVVWNQYDQNFREEQIFANYFDLQTATWKGAERLNTGQVFAGRVQVAFDTLGNAVAVWDGQGKLNANRFDTTSKTWGEVKNIRSPASTSFTAPSVAFDAANKARVIWFESTASNNVYNLFSAVMASDTSLLGTPTLIQQGKSFNWEAPGLKRLPSGDFFTAFNQEDQSNIIHTFVAQIP